MKFVDAKKYKKHTWLHRSNPFNAALKNVLKNTLSAAPTAGQTYTSPVLNQGEYPYCAEYCDAGTVAAITGQPCDPMQVLNNVLSYLNQQQPQYTGADLKTAMSVIVDPGTPTFSYSAILYIYPESGQSFCEAVNSYIQQYKRPANLGGVWYDEMFSAVNGVITAGAGTVDGGHDMMLCGIGTDGMMLNQGSWGTAAGGSNQGFYRFSPDVFDSYYTGFPCGIGINSTNNTVILLGRLSSLYIKLVDILS